MSASVFLLAVGLFWVLLLVVSLALAAANGRDSEKVTVRD